MLCVSEDAGGRASEQEQMDELGVDCGDDVVILLQDEACDLVER